MTNQNLCGFCGVYVGFFLRYFVEINFCEDFGEIKRKSCTLGQGKKTNNFTIDAGTRDMRSNTMSGTDISTVSEMMPSQLQIMKIQSYQHYIFPSGWEYFCPSISKS